MGNIIRLSDQNRTFLIEKCEPARLSGTPG